MPSARRIGPSTLSVASAWLTLALAAAACSSSGEHPGWGASDTPPDIDVPRVTPCTDGAVKACGSKLDERDGVVTCATGSQTCSGGVWGECTQGTITTLALPSYDSGPGTHVLSLSTPGDCVGNPCDPRCQVFDEVPPEPVQSVEDEPVYEWETGSLAGFPNGLVSKGLKEPCSTGADCQLNTYCNAPALGACSHAVCETGAALADGCNECVTRICDADPTCCAAAPEVNSCSHDPCARGTSLKTGCNSCVTKICEKLPNCCSNSGSWDSACVAEVANTCGNTCECDSAETRNGSKCYFRSGPAAAWSTGRNVCTARGADWDLARIDDAAENAYLTDWGSGGGWIGFTDQKAFSSAGTWKWTTGTGSYNEATKVGTVYTSFANSEPASTDECARLGTGGAWYGQTCWSTYASLCEGPPVHMKAAPGPVPTWDADCVAKVSSVCGAVCDEESAASTAGSCQPWYPGETSETCSGIDLSIAAPCDGVVPVCNHGNATAPSGLELVHFPANSQQYPSCSPNLSHPQIEQCFTTEPIPPGECINVTGCPGLSGNREIMVNPTGASHVAECSCLDNWSLFSGGECGPPICAGGSSEAELVKKPVDIIFVIDNSGSMAGEIEAVQARINDDLVDIIGASGIDYRVIMIARYGDVDIAVGGSDHPICVKKPLGGNDCTNPSTEPLTLNPPRFYHYSADIGSLDSWCKLLTSYHLPDEQPSGNRAWTPLAPSGWSQWLRPEAFKVFVEITDDDVSCTIPGTTFNDLGTKTGGETAASKFDTAILSLDPDQFGTSASRNYIWHSIVAMAPNSPATTAWPPTAAITTSKCTPGSEGPGTGYQALSVLTGGLRYPTCQNSDFDAIFNAIAVDVVEKSSVSCEYALPAADDSYDPAQATVTYSSTAAGDKSVSLDRVSNLAACSNKGWYYDDPVAPTVIHLCPDACEDIQADDTARVWVELGCPGVPAPQTVTEVYSGVCEEGEATLWLDLGYKASLPGNANLEFRARLAQSKAALGSAAWVSLGTATTAQQECPLGADCTIDVFAALGGRPQALLPVLELEMTLNPSSTGESAVLSDWQLAYSCRDDE